MIISISKKRKDLMLTIDELLCVIADQHKISYEEAIDVLERETTESIEKMTPVVQEAGYYSTATAV